jgi:hypothetical protein
MAQRLERGLGELQQALADRGFTHARLSVQHLPAGGDAPSAPSTRDDRRGAAEDPRDEHHPHPEDQRDPSNEQPRRRAPRQNSGR